MSEPTRPADEYAKLLADVRKADALYRPFPPLTDWAGIAIDEGRWAAAEALVTDAKSADPKALARARAVVRRAAAVDTGAIEGLYDVDPGFTMSVALQTITMEAVQQEKGPRVRALIESQMRAYEWLLDFATQRLPITEAWIRSLHEDICRDQEDYLALTEVGHQLQPLPKGQYKTFPNHVRLPSGDVFPYAPVEVVPDEMFRLVETLRSPVFEGAHPVIQAAFAHYAFVRIHPFADGNGRVARALASVFTYRALSVPILILSSHREAYLASIRKADVGDYLAFVDFLFARVRESARLTSDSLEAARSPAPAEAVSSVIQAFRTRGGYTHTEIDVAGYALFDEFLIEFKNRFAQHAGAAQLTVGFVENREIHAAKDESHRSPVLKGGRLTAATLAAPPPGEVSIDVHVNLEVPKNAALDDTYVLRNRLTGQKLELPIEDVIPQRSVLARIRMAMFIDATIGDAIQRVGDLARDKIKKAGY